MSGSGPLVVGGVSVSAGSTQILSHISATLYPGELCALLGPSGAGKSTFIKVLLGLRETSGGAVRLGDAPVKDAGPIGYVPQDDALHRTLSVEKELLYAARLRLPDSDDDARRARVEEVLRQVGLEERRGLPIGRLSGGQRKRVSVALELLTSPDLLILDEPTSGLDPGLEARMMSLFQTVAKSGRCVLVATHAMESLDLCDALLLLVRGHVAFFGRPADALTFFDVGRYAEMFRALERRDGAAWARAFAAHSLKRAFEARPRPAIVRSRPAAPTTSTARVPSARTRPEPSSEESADDALAALKARMSGGGK